MRVNVGIDSKKVSTHEVRNPYYRAGFEVSVVTRCALIPEHQMWLVSDPIHTRHLFEASSVALLDVKEMKKFAFSDERKAVME